MNQAPKSTMFRSQNEQEATSSGYILKLNACHIYVDFPFNKSWIRPLHDRYHKILYTLTIKSSHLFMRTCSCIDLKKCRQYRKRPPPEDGCSRRPYHSASLSEFVLVADTSVVFVNSILEFVTQMLIICVRFATLGSGVYSPLDHE